MAGVWTALGLLSVASAAFAFRRLDRPIEWAPLLTGRLADRYTCAMFTPRSCGWRVAARSGAAGAKLHAGGRVHLMRGTLKELETNPVGR